jgi:hypothetical protein
MTKRPTAGPGAGADDDDASVGRAGEDNGQISRSLILRSALGIIDRDGVD